MFTDRLAVIEKYDGGAIVRGPRPLTEDKSAFSYEELADWIQGEDITLSEMKLIDVSLVDNRGERLQWEVEMIAFGQNPADWSREKWPPYQYHYVPTILRGKQVSYKTGSSAGSLCWWPVQGMSVTDKPDIFLGSSGWNFSGLVNHIKYLSVAGRVIFFHCSSGIDRTGALHTGYLMKWKDKSFQEACEICDSATAEGAPNSDYKRLREAYAKSIGKA